MPYGLPEYLDGEKHDYSFLEGDADLEGLKTIDGFESNESALYRLSRRFDENGKEYLYIVNVSDDECEVVLRKDGARSLLSYDAVT